MKLLLAAATILAAAICPISAATFSATGDFSISSNPNGPWSYGNTATLGSTFNTFSSTGTAGCASGWQTINDPPYIAANTTGADMSCLYFTIPAGDMHIHPGGDDSYSVVRWTAPDSATYLITGFFEAINPNVHGTDEHILHNGSELFATYINTYRVPASFSLSVAITAGDTIDFAVGPGGNHYFDDSTGMQATISSDTATPEPASLLLGLGGIIGVVLRRRNVGA